MKKLMLSAVSLLLGAALAVTAFATLGEGDQRVFDYAGLFSAEEAEALEAQVAQVREAVKMDVVVVTIDDAMGKIGRDYADDFYDENGFGVGSTYSGVLLLIDMENREAVISTCGKMIDYLTDERIEFILDDVFEGLSVGDYAAGAAGFLSGVDFWVARGVPEGQHRYDEDTGKVTYYKSLEIGEIVIALVVSLAVGTIVCVLISRRYQMKTKQYEYPYRKMAVLNLTNRQDVFLHATTTHRRISTSSGGSGGGGGGSSGRSSTHRSSSGRSHGGGSRKF